MSLPNGSSGIVKDSGSSGNSSSGRNTPSAGISGPSTSNGSGHTTPVGHNNNPMNNLSSANPFSTNGSQGRLHVQTGSARDTTHIYSAPSIYYGENGAAAKRDFRNRTFSAVVPAQAQPNFGSRRLSLDVPGDRSFDLPVKTTLAELLKNEDTDNNYQITIEDAGPGVLRVGTSASGGHNRTEIRGHYALACLLQELTFAEEHNRSHITLNEARINENPVDRLSRFIGDMFWENLTRRIDGSNVAHVARDPKDWTSDPRPRIYIPPGAPEQYEYYSNIAKDQPEIRLDVQWLATDVTPEYIRDLNNAPGLLAVGMDYVLDKNGNNVIDKHGMKLLQGKPFIVPGGRFNEFYGWDSYMASLGLIIQGKVHICKSMVENFAFCIEHYGKILNANRSYYLGRSQPPFLTDMILRVYEKIHHEPGAMDFLRLGTLAAIKEYYSVWMAEPRLDERTGLSRYRPTGVGVPPETEPSHFTHVLEPYAKKHNMTHDEFVDAYTMKRVHEPELDEYFLHDRAVRESGHDTSYRLEKVAANLATVDLNSCLFKIENDIAKIIKTYFDGKLAIPKEFQTKGMQVDQVETTGIWERRFRKRRVAMDKYMWSAEDGIYYDYDTVKQERTTYESATTFWAMWAGVATTSQASLMVIKGLPKFELFGGLVSGTEKSRGKVGLSRPNRQWDFPFGWAPHQILAWIGLQRYNFQEEAERLAYRWCYMVTKAFVDFNGIVVEKYDLTRPADPQRVEAEYGNQGADFKGVPREGFGWVNSSYILGVSILSAHQRRALGTLTDWETFAKATQELDVYGNNMSALHTGSPEQAAAEHGIQFAGPHGNGSHVGYHPHTANSHATGGNKHS